VEKPFDVRWRLQKWAIEKEELGARSRAQGGKMNIELFAALVLSTLPTAGSALAADAIKIGFCRVEGVSDQAKTFRVSP
jgi:hypothetical protein